MAKIKKRRVIITVIGKDMIGIIAAITNLLASNQINILDISQTTMEGIFTMTMIVDLEESVLTIAQLSNMLKKLGEKIAQEIHVQDEKIIQAMYRL